MVEVPYKFPHYLPAETEIVKRFLRDEVIKGNWSFDVRLGYNLTEQEKQLPPEEQKMIISLKERRIDAVCETPSEIWIIEVKDKLRPSGMGQLETYKFLYAKQFHPSKPIKLGYLAAIDDKTMHDILYSKGITFWVVPI